MEEEPGDPELVALARRGDGDAFDRLVRRHAPMVYRVLRHLSLSPEEAEETAQDVFIRAWRGLDGFEGRARLTTWLYRIAVNEARRRQGRRPRVPDAPQQGAERGAEPAAERADDPSLRPEARLLRRELDRQITAALSRLAPDRRVAVVLRDIEGLSTEEAAAIVGIRAAAFKSRLHRGRLELRAQLEPYLDLAD